MSDDGSSAEVAVRTGSLAGELAVKGLSREKYELICNTVAKGANALEVALFLELAQRYELDPFAREVWCVKGERQDGGESRLLIMVGRDGLRKIAQRNGLRIDGDVVRAKDRFVVTREKDRTRTIEHAYAEARAEDDAHAEGERTHEEIVRGPIVGAWAEVWVDEGGQQRGYFYAPMSEYKPTNAKKLQYSPWGSQTSVMILSAAERQSLRQATPLSGLLVEGEMDLNRERAAGMAADDPGAQDVVERAVREVVSEEWAPRLIPLVLRVNELKANTWLPSAIQMQFGQQSEETLERWVSDLTGVVETLEQEVEAEQPPEAELVETGPGPEVVEKVEGLRARERELAERFAMAEGGSREESEVGDELEVVRDEIRALGFAASDDPAGDL